MNTGRNIISGIRTGLLLGGIFSVWAAIVFLLNGGKSIERYNGVTFPEVAGAYLVGGLLGGALVGALYPLVRYKVGAFLVGITAAFPFSVAVMGSLQGFSPWTGGHTFVVCLMSVTIGAVTGAILYSE